MLSTKSIGEVLKDLRENKKLPQRKVAAMIDIDTAILSKMERGERNLTKGIIKKLCEVYIVDADPLIIQFLSEKIINDLSGEPLALKAVEVAEKLIKSNLVKHSKKSF